MRTRTSAPIAAANAGRKEPPRRQRELGDAVRVVRDDAGAEDGAGLADAENRCDRGVRQDRGRRPRRHDAACLEEHHRRREPRHLLRGVAHVEDRHGRRIAQPLEERQDLVLARRVEGGKGLVHQEHLGPCEERAADRDALFLAARERPRPPVEEVADAEEVDDARLLGRVARGTGEPAPVAEILADGEMGKEPPLLEDVADAAAVRRHDDAPPGIEERPPADRDAAPLGAHEARDGVDDGRLPRPGAAEERGDARRRIEGDVEREAAEAVEDRDLDHPAIRRATARARTSERRSAAIATAIATRTSRIAGPSPPGTWRKA
jgi:hypothetical protein